MNRKSVVVTLLLLIASAPLAACGSGDSGSTTTTVSYAEKERRAKARQEAADEKVRATCHESMDPLISKLSDLDAELGVGMTEDDYGDAVRRLSVRSSRAMDAAGDLDAPDPEGAINCLKRVGLKAEHAVNIHIKTANIWNECIVAAYDGTCDSSSDAFSKKLQGRWLKATLSAAEAEQGFDEVTAAKIE